MNLGFSTKINNKSTYFVEKIINCLLYDLKLGAELNPFLNSEKLGYKDKTELIESINSRCPKRHTMRTNDKTRWNVENNIHFVINNRTPKRFQFTPVIPVKSVQKIEIKWMLFTKEIINRKPIVWIDSLPFYDVTTGLNRGIEILSKNDGFESEKEFFEWFNVDFIGKIIHWTDVK